MNEPIAEISGLVKQASMRLVKLALALAILLGQPITDGAYAQSANKPARLEGMEYLSARQSILAFGWAPLPGNCSGGGTSTDTCATYPEIGNCSGTGVGFCDMTFVRRDRCLIVVTVGGEPRANRRGEPIVRDVQFRRGPCSKN